MQLISNQESLRAQPMDAGIIAALKARYRKELLSRMLNNVDDFETLREVGSKITTGKRGLEYASTPHMLDVAQIVAASWNNVSADLIRACWQKANCLPFHLPTALSQEEELVPKGCARDLRSHESHRCKRHR